MVIDAINGWRGTTIRRMNTDLSPVERAVIAAAMLMLVLAVLLSAPGVLNTWH